MSQGGPMTGRYVKQILGSWSIIQKHHLSKCPYNQQKQGAVFAWLHKKIKLMVEKRKCKFGKRIALVPSHQVYVRICFWPASRYSSVKNSSHVDGILWPHWSMLLCQGNNLKPQWRRDSVYGLSIHQKRKSNKYGMICSSTHFDGCYPYISVCPSVNSIFTGPITMCQVLY